MHVERGEPARAAAIVDDLAARPVYPVWWARAAAGVAMAGGDLAAARRLLTPALDAAASSGLWGHLQLGLPLLVELEHADGNANAARDQLAILELVAERMGAPLVRVRALRARGLVTSDPAPLRQALAVATTHGLVSRRPWPGCGWARSARRRASTCRWPSPPSGRSVPSGCAARPPRCAPMASPCPASPRPGAR
ncbi:MAG TPA: hypothetical protein VEY96_10090 [Actinomycetes bacterium]|nr:hypothetical protein [Actinomycetes bacterium]